MNKPTCKVHGMIRPGAMCGSVIVGAKYCGSSLPCPHKGEPVAEPASSQKAAALAAQQKNEGKQ